MTVAAPTFSQIKAQVAAIRQKSSNGEAIGLHASGRWTGAVEQSDGRDRFRIYQCDSPLALRLALRDQAESETIKVLITPLSETELEEDILLRLTKRKLFAIDSWQIAQSLFRAYDVDPRLRKHRWMADLLLDWLPTRGGYPTVSSGFLDAETVWPLLLSQGMGLNQEHPDLADILVWSTDPDLIAQYRCTPEDFQMAAAEWLAAMAGAAAMPILQCVAGSNRPDALPIGLAAQVLFNTDVGHQLDRAIGKMEERFLQGKSPHPDLMLRWGDAAAQALQRDAISPTQRVQLIQRGDEILEEVGAAGFAYLSRTSARGFDLRLSQVAIAIGDFLAKPSEATGDRFSDARTAVTQHKLASENSSLHRIERLDMAARLIRWLNYQETQTPSAVSDLEGAVEDYVLEGSFLDWARQRMLEGDPLRQLSEAYKQLFDQVTVIREQQNQSFAEHLKNWLAVGSTRLTLRPIETLLDRLIAPLANQTPVLMLVLDGMAMAVCRELLADLSNHSEWTTIIPEGMTSTILPGLATVPSLTKTSRASLFCGQLTVGSANTESKGFANHPALLKACRPQHPPRLFHKNALEDAHDGVLSQAIRDALQDSQNRVVGAVINAVDDLLDKGGQINTRWDRGSIKVLDALLQSAKSSGRLVILLSDHGHVIDIDTTYVSGGEGARWRAATSTPSDQELHVKGARVLDPDAGAEAPAGIVVPWSEKLRYGTKKTGYHGGITPQEMIIPIAVLTTSDQVPKGWTEAPIDTPVWWEELVITPDAIAEPIVRPEDVYADLGPLFQQAQSISSSPDWIASLLTVSLYQAQYKKAGRLAPNPDAMRVLLTLLERNHFQLKLSSIIRALNFAPSQGRSFIGSAQRVLNIDGHAILTINRTENTVVLNQRLLIQQFGLN